MIDVKALVTKVGDLSKLTFKQKILYIYDESNLIFTRFTQSVIKNYKYII